MADYHITLPDGFKKNFNFCPVCMNMLVEDRENIKSCLSKCIEITFVGMDQYIPVTQYEVGLIENAVAQVFSNNPRAVSDAVNYMGSAKHFLIGLTLKKLQESGNISEIYSQIQYKIEAIRRCRKE